MCSNFSILNFAFLFLAASWWTAQFACVHKTLALICYQNLPMLPTSVVPRYQLVPCQHDSSPPLCLMMQCGGDGDDNESIRSCVSSADWTNQSCLIYCRNCTSPVCFCASCHEDGCNARENDYKPVVVSNNNNLMKNKKRNVKNVPKSNKTIFFFLLAKKNLLNDDDNGNDGLCVVEPNGNSNSANANNNNGNGSINTIRMVVVVVVVNGNSSNSNNHRLLPPANSTKLLLAHAAHQKRKQLVASAFMQLRNLPPPQIIQIPENSDYFTELPLLIRIMLYPFAMFTVFYLLMPSSESFLKNRCRRRHRVRNMKKKKFQKCVEQ